MRTSLVCAAFLGVLAAGCAGELTGTGEGDDVQPPENCGDGAVDSGETCDDGNTTNGDGCSSVCQSEQQVTPKLTVSIDKTSVNTELNTTTMITVSLQGEGGFNETVNLTGAVVDAAEMPLVGWTVTFDTPSIAVTEGVAATAVATVKVPSLNSGLAGTLKINATSSLGSELATATFSVMDRITIRLANNGTACVYPVAGAANAIEVKVGTLVRFENAFATNTNVIVHSNGGTLGVPHEDVGGGHLPGGFYDTNPNNNQPLRFNVAGQFDWYCHSPGPNLTNVGGNTNPFFKIVQ